MDHPDQRKLHTPVHEGHGVHVCHKCGWPFPNPHPSARHRRAHKRICGTVEGYKLVESEEDPHLTVSDEDRLSDEDHHDRTLSPKVLETSNNEQGSGGNWERSNRSEDEVFSDAVAEFPDSGVNPGIEERLAKDDPNITQSFKNGGIPDIIQPPSISTDSSQMRNPEVPENTTHLLGSTPQSLDHVSSSLSFYSDCMTEESVLTLGYAEDVLASDSDNIKPETLTDTSQENEKTNAGEDVRECSLTTVGPETDGKGTGDINVDRNLPDIVVEPSKISGNSFEVVSEESVGKTSNPVPAVGVVQSEEEHTNDSSSKMTQIDHPPEVESANHVNASIDTSETEVNVAKGIQYTSSGKIIDSCNRKEEGNESVHVLSVPDDTPVVDHPEIMFENFKDDTGLKLDQSVSQDSCVTIMGKEDGAKGPASEEKFSSCQSRQLSEEHNDGSSSKMIQIDHTPEVESADHVDASIETSGIEVDAAKGIQCTSSGKIIDSCNRKEEGNESVHVLSVPDDTPVVDHPEIMFENFKDDTGLILDQSVSQDSCVTIMGKEDGAKGPASEEKFSSCQSRQLSEEHNDGSSSKMIQIDHTPEVESADHVDASIETSGIEVDAAKGIQCTSFGKIIDSCNRKEGGNESVHVLSVPDDTPVVDYPEITVENFNDDTGVKLDQSVPLDSCVTIMGKEDGAKGPASEEKFSSFQSRQLSEDTGIPSLDLHVLENILEQEGQNSKAAPVKEEADVSQFKVTINEIGAPAEVSMPEMDKIHTAHSHEERESHDIFDDSLLVTFPENAKKFLPDSASNQTSNLVGVHSAGNYEKATIERFDAIGGDNEKEATEEKYTVESIKTSESAANHAESLVISTVNLPEGVIDGRESREGPKEENISLNPKLTSESANSLELQAVADDIMDESVKKSPETECTLLDGVPYSSTVGITNVSDSQEGIKDGAIHVNGKVYAESVGGFSTADETFHGGDVKSLEKTSEEFLTNELCVSPLDAESSIQSSAAVEDNNVREFGMGASGIISDSLEGDNNFVKQQYSASAIDVSVDSFSQTDSLEGNWGSVSVLSTLSDAPAVSDTEALPSTDSQASAAEKTDLEKPKAESEGQRSEKSDMFEAPSFMTLVETRDGSDQKGAASDETVQNPKLQSDASLQAGWFPSLTHVVNESQGRRKNEEIIAKVTNWSTGKQHTPLKSLLGEASLESKPKSPKSKENPGPVIQKEEKVPKDNGAVATTVNSILGPESPTAQAAKIETKKEWNSPARYPSAEIKREKRKVKGRPYWVQFVCCSSIN